MRTLADIRPAVILFFPFLLLGCSKSTKPTDPAALEIQQRLEQRAPAAAMVLTGDSVLSPDLLRLFYARRSFSPAWSDEAEISSSADSLVALLRSADREGLDPRDYHVDALALLSQDIRTKSREGQGDDVPARAKLDLLLSDAFMLYACHLSEGKIDHDSLRPRWPLGEEKREYAELLEKTLREKDISRTVRTLAPAHSFYADLRDLLRIYEAQAKRTSWGIIPRGAPMKPGDTGQGVFLLRNKLRALGDLTSRSPSAGDEFDSTLVDAVRIFQRRHGLEQTGIADSATMVALNVSPSRRLEQIIVNLERWRWMPHSLGRRHVRVNIPDFMLTVSEDGRDVMSMKVVLGLPGWQTPVFSADMNEVLFNSHWLAPEDIVEKELINYMKADSNYLRNNQMTLWRESGDSLVLVDPRSINWALIQPTDIDFRLRQEGGPQNIMGQVKFLIPNKYSVYLHDTPYREDFPKSVRMFSHGCIRLEKPFEFAEYILRDFPEWSREMIDTVLARNKKHSILLKRPIPVHVCYVTVWKGRDGSVQFREDCYGLDKQLGEVLLSKRR